MVRNGSFLDWAQFSWLMWPLLYVILGVLVPIFMVRAWAHEHKSSVQPRTRQIFQHGELGLVSLMITISVIWDLQKSQFTPHTIALGSVILAFCGIMAGAVWIESYCRRSTGVALNNGRVWRDSRNFAFLVFSMASVAEVLLDRLHKVALQ